MDNRCHKCGTPAAGDQAFCARCGAVLGMADDPSGAASPDLAATMVGAKLPPPAAPRPAPRPPEPQPRPAAPPYRPAATAPPPTKPAGGGNTLIIVLVVGLAAVLLVGTLVLLFFLYSMG